LCVYLPSLVQRFRQVLGLETKSGIATPEAWLTELFGASPAASGVSVTPRNAMRATPVRAAIQAIAETAGQLPIHIVRREEDGSKERDREHPAFKVLRDPNEWAPGNEFREQLTRDALLHGNGFAFIGRAQGKPVELVRLDPENVSVTADTTTGEPIYKNGSTILARENVLHIRAPGCDGIKGESPVTQAREAIGLAIVMEQHAARLFGRGARPAGILTFPNKLGAETAGRIKQSWQAAHGGENSGGTAVLEEGGGFSPLTFTSVDAQFLELRAFAVSEIARVFRVPPVLIQDYGRATWSNSAEMGRQFLTYTLAPWLKRWEGEIRLKLIDPQERHTCHAEFLVDDLLRSDTGSRAAAYAQFRSAGILTANECRAMENRAPLPGGDVLENPFTSTSTGAANA
jgi:HK97 family phage portal protein